MQLELLLGAVATLASAVAHFHSSKSTILPDSINSISPFWSLVSNSLVHLRQERNDQTLFRLFWTLFSTRLQPWLGKTTDSNHWRFCSNPHAYPTPTQHTERHRQALAEFLTTQGPIPRMRTPVTSSSCLRKLKVARIYYLLQPKTNEQPQWTESLHYKSFLCLFEI